MLSLLPWAAAAATAVPGSELQRAVDAAVKEGRGLLRVAPGAYDFGNATLTVADAEDLTIVADGASTAD